MIVTEQVSKFLDIYETEEYCSVPPLKQLSWVSWIQFAPHTMFNFSALYYYPLRLPSDLLIQVFRLKFILHFLSLSWTLYDLLATFFLI
jgi:hypothetical protein